MDVQVDRATSPLYAKLEERVMARDQVGASQVRLQFKRSFGLFVRLLKKWSRLRVIF